MERCEYRSLSGFNPLLDASHRAELEQIIGQIPQKYGYVDRCISD